MSEKSSPKKRGRPKGSVNKTTAARRRREARAALQGQTPLEYMLEVMRDKERSQEVRMDAAKAAAPYCHARLTATTIKEEKPSGARDVSTAKLKSIVEKKAA